MENHWTALVENMTHVDWGKRMALRQVVRNVPSLWYSFQKTLNHDEDTNDFGVKFKEFIRQQNFRFVDIKPVIRVRDNRYVVDVYYTVEW